MSSRNNKELFSRLARLEKKVFPYYERPMPIHLACEFLKLARRECLLNNPENYPADEVERARNYRLPENYDHFMTHMWVWFEENKDKFKRPDNDPNEIRSWPVRMRL
jgi:hypothetical protein